MPREIVVDWTTQAGGGMVSVFFCDLAVFISTERTAISNFLGSVDGSLVAGTAWTIRTSGRELDDATGALTGAWSEPTARTGVGAASGSGIPDASQVLFRWKTSTIVNGRFLQGRTFVPGLNVGALTGQNVTPSVKTVFDGYAATLVAGATGVGVWHRPILAAGGEFHGATSGECWSELAVLRRRRF